MPRGHPRYPIHRAFEAALISRVRSGRWPPEAEDMLRAMECVSAPYYGVDAEEIWSRARGVDHLGGARVPLLVLHPEDDHIIKVDQARMLAGGGEGQRPRPGLDPPRRLPRPARGGRSASWTHAVYRGFFERWATYAERGRPAAPEQAAELVYSSEQPG